MADVDTTVRYTTVRYTSYFLSRGAYVQSLLSLRCMFAWSFCGNHPNTKQPWLQQLLAHAYIWPMHICQQGIRQDKLQCQPSMHCPGSRLLTLFAVKAGLKQARTSLEAWAGARDTPYAGAAEILFRKAVGSQKMLRTARCMHWRVKSSNDMRGHMGMQRHLYRLSSALDREPR